VESDKDLILVLEKNGENLLDKIKSLLKYHEKDCKGILYWILFLTFQLLGKGLNTIKLLLF